MIQTSTSQYIWVKGMKPNLQKHNQLMRRIQSLCSSVRSILQASALNIEGNTEGKQMCAFTYLRMNPQLFQGDNWRRFVSFVKKMKEGKNTQKCREQVEREAEHFVHVTTPLVQEAAHALMH